ncbi:hypothetical protein TURU_158495 [Turdus rufiventris]|nr:hypothetical protein TURU_158495 [Turdus rufiventris]
MKWKPIISIVANRLATYSAEHENLMNIYILLNYCNHKSNEQKDAFGQRSFPENLCWRGGKNLLAYLDTVESFHYVNQPGYPEPDGKKTWVTMLKTREETVVSKMYYGETINVEALK